jgi:hypothetical protein
MILAKFKPMCFKIGKKLLGKLFKMNFKYLKYLQCFEVIIGNQLKSRHEGSKSFVA